MRTTCKEISPGLMEYQASTKGSDEGNPAGVQKSKNAYRNRLFRLTGLEFEEVRQ